MNEALFKSSVNTIDNSSNFKAQIIIISLPALMELPLLWGRVSHTMLHSTENTLFPFFFFESTQVCFSFFFLIILFLMHGIFFFISFSHKKRGVSKSTRCPHLSLTLSLSPQGCHVFQRSHVLWLLGETVSSHLCCWANNHCLILLLSQACGRDKPHIRRAVNITLRSLGRLEELAFLVCVHSLRFISTTGL